MKSLTTIKSLGAADLTRIVDTAISIRDQTDSGETDDSSLAGRGVANLFFEPSTRTRLSFDLAAQRLGAHVITHNPSTSSMTKGETLRDTSLTVAAMGVDILVVRTREDGGPQEVAEWTGLPVVNAGDGMSEHPTQTLLDAVTVKRQFGRFDGLRLGLVGDIAHSRVAGSLMEAFPVLGLDVTLIAPSAWLPSSPSLATTDNLDSAIEDLDIVYLLRVQTERGGEVSGDYVERFQLDDSRMARMKEEAIVMHPGPINRGVEISVAVADSPRSKITEQVRNGVPTRMAVLASIGAELA